MNENIINLEAEHGAYTFDGVSFVLTQDAYIDWTGDNSYYTALAIRKDANPDEDGIVDAYRVTWSIPDSTRAYWAECEENGDPIDNSDDCDWENPDDVQLYGGWILEEARFV